MVPLCKWRANIYIYFITSEGHMGSGLRSLKSRDIICVMLGGPTPYALRPTKSGELLFVGECFLYGSIHSEAVIRITIDIAVEMRKSSQSSFWSPKTTRVPSSRLAYFHLLQLLELQHNIKVLALGSSRRASPSLIREHMPRQSLSSFRHWHKERQEAGCQGECRPYLRAWFPWKRFPSILAES